MATESVRLSSAILSQARKEAGVMSRTLQAQLEHWARVGQPQRRQPATLPAPVKPSSLSLRLCCAQNTCIFLALELRSRAACLEHVCTLTRESSSQCARC